MGLQHYIPEFYVFTCRFEDDWDQPHIGIFFHCRKYLLLMYNSGMTEGILNETTKLLCEHSSSPTMCNESNSEAWQGKWINELTCSNLLCSFLYCTHTGNSILNCYALACYSVTSTWENELPQFLHSTRSHNKSTFVWKVVSCLGIVLEETNCTVYWKKPQNLWLPLLQHWVECIEMNSF